MDVKIGSVWRENDKRFERYVKVLAIENGKADIVKVDASGDGFTFYCPITKAKLSRFRKAYKRVEVRP